MPIPTPPVVKMFCSYVGSKAHWLSKLERYRGRDFVEPFAGSAVISFNLAKSAHWNDNDPVVAKILSTFDTQIVPDTFTESDYFAARTRPDWHRSSFCLSKCSFSGVFRYSKNGFNVPIKKNIPPVQLRGEYEGALARWRELRPTVTCLDYLELPAEAYFHKTVLVDPPYADSVASYVSASFDYPAYWDYLHKTVCPLADTVILFDRAENLAAQKIPLLDTRKMRVNGARQGSLEALAIFDNGNWLTAEKWSNTLGLPV